MNSLTQALQDFKNWASKTAVGSFVQNNPTPAGFAQRQLTPVAQKFVQSVQSAWSNPQPSPRFTPVNLSPQQYAQQNIQNLQQRVAPAVAKFTAWVTNAGNQFNQQAQNSINSQQALQKQGIYSGYTITPSRAIVTDYQKQIRQMADKLPTFKWGVGNPIKPQGYDVNTGAIARGALDLVTGGAYSADEQSLLKKVNAGNTDFTPQELVAARNLQETDRLAIMGLTKTPEIQNALRGRIALTKTPEEAVVIYNDFAEKRIPSAPIDLDPAWINESPTLSTKGGLGLEMARSGYTANEIARFTPGEAQKLLVENLPGQQKNIMEAAYSWKDKPRLSYARETMERNFADIMGDDAPKMIDKYIQPVYSSGAERINWLNKERAEIKALGIAPRSRESTIVQQLGEGLISKRDVSLRSDAEKIFTAEKVLRDKYDGYLSKLNTVLRRNGYDAIPKRQDYFRHFTEIKGLLEQVGIPVREHSLPTDINGLTADFRPGRQFFASTLQRKTDVTDYDAIQGIDGYIEGASKQIFQTDNIKRLRRLDKALRDTFAGTRHLTNFVADLTEYTNVLAGKKAMIDRSAETSLGRGIYAAADRLRRQTGANMVGFNVSSAMTNFIPLTQSLAVTDKPSFVRGMMQTIGSVFKDDGFINHSQFLTSRHGSDKLSMNAWEKIGDKSFWLFKVIDNFVSGTIVRSKFAEGMKKGMSQGEAMKQADAWARKIMAGRSAGEMPTLFSSKTLGLVTQFQLEVNNQLSFMFKDIPRNFNKTGAASALAQVFLYSYIFNNVFEKASGRRPAFDPIWVALQTYEDYTNPDMKKTQATKNAVENVSNQFPFTSVLTGGRIPIGSAIPNPLAVARGDSTWTKEGKKLFYLIPPTGGGQLRKIIEGTRAYQQEASTTDKDLVRYPIPQTPVNAVRTAIGGQYVTPEARQYFRQGESPLSEKQSQLFFQSPNKIETYQQIMQKREDDSQIQSMKEQVKQTSTPSFVGATYVFIDPRTGDTKAIDTSFQPTVPTYTGNYELDKQIKSKFFSEITKKKGIIVDLYEQKQLTGNEAEKQLSALETLKASTGSGRASTGRKIAIRSMKVPSVKLAKASSTRRLKLRMPKLTYVKPVTAKRIKVALPKQRKLKLRSVASYQKQFLNMGRKNALQIAKSNVSRLGS